MFRSSQSDRNALGRRVLTVALIAALALSGSWLAASPAHASDALRKELSAMSDSIVKILKRRGVTQVAVGPFEENRGQDASENNLPTNAGPGIAQIFKEELEGRGLSVVRTAEYTVNGNYTFTQVQVDDPQQAGRKQDIMAVRVVSSVMDRSGDVLVDLASTESARFQASVTDESTVVTLAGVPVDLPPGEPPTETQARIKEIVLDGQFAQAKIKNNSQVFAGADSPYGMEIRVAGRPKPAILSGDLKLPQVDIGAGDRYEIVLYNNSAFDAAVELSVDGVNTFAFSEEKFESGEKQGRPKYERWVIPAGQSAIVRGWHRHNAGPRALSAFEVAPYPESAAALLGRQDGIGVVTAVFSAAWLPGGNPPPDEPTAGARSAPLGTKMGPPIGEQLTEAKREFGVVRASVSIRYAK